MTLPGRFPGRLGRASTLLLNVVPNGKIATAETGQALTFARASVGGHASDTLGRVRQTIHSQPKWEAVDLDGDGVRETMGLLLEPARTNAFDNSEDWTAGAWAKTGTTITADAITAPDGRSVADKIKEDNTSGPHNISRATGALTASTYSSFSVWMKAAERSFGVIHMLRKDNTWGYVFFNLTTGVVVSASANCRGRIERGVNGWWRCLASFDSLTGATAGTLAFGTSSDGTLASYTGTTGSGIYAWGAQWEIDQPFPTSYLGGSGARSGDALSMTPAWPMQDFTVYAKIARPWWADLAGDIGILPFMLHWGAAAYCRVYFDQTTRTIVSAAYDGTAVTSGGGGVIPAGQLIEVCVQFANLSSGAKVRTDVGAGFSAYSTTIAAMPTPTGDLYIGNDTAATRRLSAPLLSFKLAAGARTLDEMRGAY